MHKITYFPVTVRRLLVSILEDLNVRLNINLSTERTNQSPQLEKNIVKSVKLQSLVAKCCKVWKM